MNTLEIAKAITKEDIEKAKQIHFQWKADLILDGLQGEVDLICKEKGLRQGELNTIFTITQLRLEQNQ